MVDTLAEVDREEPTATPHPAPTGLHGPRDVGPLLWLGVPLVTLAIIWLSPVVGRETWDLLIPNEIGFLEIATELFLLPAMVMSVFIFLRRRELPRRFGWLVLLGGLAALYFAGEEISWGQTYFQWRTPEAMAELNKQGETNLHNLELAKYGPWVDLLDDVLSNIPRQTMLLMCLVGGIILPLTLRKRLAAAPQNFWHWAIPTWRIVPAAMLAVGSTIPEKLYDAFIKHNPDVPNWPRDGYAYMALVDPAGELKEYAFALVILVYIFSIYRRMGKPDAALLTASAVEADTAYTELATTAEGEPMKAAPTHADSEQPATGP